MPELQSTDVLLFCLATLIVLLVALLIRQKIKEKVREKRLIQQIKADAAYQIEEEKQRFAAAIADEKRNSEDAIRNERERISAEEDELRLLAEKDLMIRTVLALKTYGMRLDRIEMQYSSFIQEISGLMEKAITHEVGEMGQKLEKIRESISETCSETISAIENAQSTYEAYDDWYVRSSLSDINHQLDELETTVKGMRSDISDVTSKLNEISAI